MTTADPGWAVRIRQLLGAPVDDVSEQHLERLVDGEVREDADLDFKRETYGRTDKDKRELAADIAAMANDRGGMIVLGIRDEDDVATALTPVELADGEAWIRQTAAGNLAPHVPFDVHVVQSDRKPGLGYFLIVVPPSPSRPHAVRKDRDLRYPRRDGSTTRWLAEAEVANLYRDRFRAAQDDVSRINALLREGLAELELDDGSAYLAVAVVPSAPGSMPISHASIQALELWAVEPSSSPWRGFYGSPPTARAGIRRVRLGHHFHRGGPPRSSYAELHTDGSGFACEQVGWTDPRAATERQAVEVDQVALVWQVAQTLCLLGRHAVENAGAWGDALVAARLSGDQMRLTYRTHHPWLESVNEIPLARPIESVYTLPLGSLTGVDRDLLISARLVAGDLFNAFGSAEVRHIDPEGRIRIKCFPQGDRESLVSFAEARGVEISDERVPDE